MCFAVSNLRSSKYSKEEGYRPMSCTAWMKASGGEKYTLNYKSALINKNALQFLIILYNYVFCKSFCWSLQNACKKSWLFFIFYYICMFSGGFKGQNWAPSSQNTFRWDHCSDNEWKSSTNWYLCPLKFKHFNKNYYLNKSKHI